MALRSGSVRPDPASDAGTPMLQAFIVDLNGVPRGKWIFGDRRHEVLAGGMALPRSLYALDVWGCDVPAAQMSVALGDPDGHAMPVPWTATPVPWAGQAATQVLMEMTEPSGVAFFASPRQALARAVDRLAGAGFTAVVAIELEFYFVDRQRGENGRAQPPHGESALWQDWQTRTLSMDELADHQDVLEDITAACALQGIPADTALRENGPMQFEINLRHVADPLRAADYAILLKRAIKGVARRHGMTATFMALPYGPHAGSGQHVHLSLLDRDGHPAFLSAEGDLSPVLHQAVGGLLATMADSMLLFAPHANSYRRMRPDHLAPLAATWGYDNRTASVRVIRGSASATRLEHRVAGADANPYLVVAGILAGIQAGIEGRLSPGDPGGGDLSTRRAGSLPSSWLDGIERFAVAEMHAESLGEEFQRLLVACKRQEHAELNRRVPDVEYEAYLQIV